MSEVVFIAINSMKSALLSHLPFWPFVFLNVTMVVGNRQRMERSKNFRNRTKVLLFLFHFSLESLCRKGFFLRSRYLLQITIYLFALVFDANFVLVFCFENEAGVSMGNIECRHPSFRSEFSWHHQWTLSIGVAFAFCTHWTGIEDRISIFFRVASNASMPIFGSEFRSSG